MNDMKAENLESTSYPEFIEDVDQKAIYDAALLSLEGTKEGQGKKLKELIPAIRKVSERELSDPYIYSVILSASKSDQSPIQSGGPWKGYFLNPDKVVLEKDLPKQHEAEPILVGKSKLFEKDLYPLVAYWMKEKKGFGLVSSTAANFRAGGIWSNPDVVALNVTDRMGFFDVEIISAEVKSSDKAWRQVIFEAVSHRRYVDKSYFIFRLENGMSGLDQEILAYAEKFRVGICVIDLPNEQVSKLLEWGKLDTAEKLDFSESVVEVVPAPSDPVSIKDKCDFLANMKIVHKDELHRFGGK